MKEIELKPCPFCGKEATLHVTDGVCVICNNCGCRTMSLSDGFISGKFTGGAIKRVVEKWNRREGEKNE